MQLSTRDSSDIEHHPRQQQQQQQQTSRALKAASEHRAKIVTFYINGEPFRPGLRVSIVPGKDFQTLSSLYDYLNGKAQLNFGVRYIFTANGARVTSIDDLEHNNCYVISNVARFQPMTYGKSDKLDKLRNISSEVKAIQASLEGFQTFADRSPRSQSLNSKEGKIVTIVNKKDPTLRTRVFLNLRSQRAFELVIKDLGQAVMVKNARKLYTSDGEEVRSISQLKRQLSDITTFYIDSVKTQNINRFTIHQRSNSLESLNFKNFKTDQSTSDELFNHDHVKQSKIDYERNNELSRSISYFQYPPETNESDAESWEKDMEPRQSDLNMQQQQESTLNDLAPGTIRITVKTMGTQTSPPRSRQPRRRMKRKPRNKERPLDTSISKSESDLVDPKVSINNDYHANQIKPVNTQSKSTNDQRKTVDQHNSQLTKNNSLDNRNDNKIKPEVPKEVIKKSDNNISTVLPEKSNNILLNSTKSNNDKEPRALSPLILKELTNGDSISGINHQNLYELTDEERTQLFSKMISNKIKKKIESRREVKRLEEERPRVSSSYRSSFGSLDNSIDRLSVLEKMANTEYSSYANAKSPEPITAAVEDNLAKGVNVPEKNFQLTWVHGYLGNTVGNNLSILDSEEIVFFVAAIVVLWNPKTLSQRHYLEHSQDIKCLALDHDKKFIATGEESIMSNGALFSGSEVRVWEAKTLKTVAIFENVAPSSSLASLSFSNTGFLLVLCCNKSYSLIIWDWKKDERVLTIKGKLSHNEKLLGAVFHRIESDIVISYGHKHLTFWQIAGVKYSSVSAINPAHTSNESYDFNCIEILPDDNILTGSSNGNLAIWSFNSKNGKVFRVTNFNGHEASIECLFCLPNNIIVSGDFSGILKSWDFSGNSFRHLNTVTANDHDGGLVSITASIDLISSQLNVYVGTRGNSILTAAVLNDKTFITLFEGHSGGLRGVEPFPIDFDFFTCGLDSKVCRWNRKKLVWKTMLETQLLSIAAHPTCLALAVGTVNGAIQILETATGNLAAQLAVCKAPIVCLAYSPDGNLLAAGGHDGTMYLLPVFDDGFSYEKVSVLKGPYPILSLQWSTDCCFILTSVNDNNFQELILWDLPNFRYLTGISSFSENLNWYNATCSGGEDVRAIWDNHNINDVVNVCCHTSFDSKLLVTGDEEGNIRLFTYPCPDPKSAFYLRKQGSTGVVEARFLPNNQALITANFEGTVFIWTLYDSKQS